MKLLVVLILALGRRIKAAQLTILL